MTLELAQLERKARIESVKGTPVGKILAGVRKFANHYRKDISGRKVTGIFSVLGNIDDYNDRIWPGAFAKTLLESTPRVKFLWGHDLRSPSIAKILNVREVGFDALPDVVKQIAPDAIGGMEVTREYLEGVELADWVLKTYEADIEGEMSFMFDAMRYDLETPSDAKYDWDKIRNLREVRLWEISDVNFGANVATMGSKYRMPDDVLVRQVAMLAEEIKVAVKAGARHSTDDMKIINDLHDMLVDLGCTTCKGIVDEAKHADTAAHDTDATDATSSGDTTETPNEKAANANTSGADAPSLTQLHERLKQLTGSI